MSVRGDLERDVVIVACAISAGVHAALTPAHFTEGAGPGAGFLVSTLLLSGLAVALTRRADPVTLGPAALVLAGLIASYTLAVTTGLPMLHPEREPLDGLAITTKLVEIAGLACSVDLLRRVLPTVAGNRLQPKGTTS